MNVKILGAGCSVCQSMYNTVTQIVASEQMGAEVEDVTDVDKILWRAVDSRARNQ